MVVLLGWSFAASAQYVAFNDQAGGSGTDNNTTLYGPAPAVTSGLLKESTAGTNLPVTVTVTSSGLTLTSSQGYPNYGTPAFIVFDGFVDFVGSPNPSVEVDLAGDFLTYTFTGLKTNAEYNFQGTAVRGDASYVDRWTLFEITGADSFTSLHSTGTLTTAKVPALGANQVAVNTGANLAGDLAWWEHIRPGVDGSFAVTSKKYMGTVPGGSSAGIKAYAMTGFRLEQGGMYSGRTNVPPPPPPSPTNLAPATINGVKTVFLVLMENHDWSTIIGNAFCPYINNTLLPMSSYCNQFYSPPGNHPSLPNYLWLVAGTNFGIRNDSPPSVNRQSTTNTLFHQLDAAGISWKAYQEDVNGITCPDADAYPYAVRHNPFVFFDSVRNNLNYCTNHVRPFTELARDLTNNTVPRFVFITPNVTNDMHDTTPGSPSSRLQGDNWLAREMPKILTSQAYSNGGALIITFDEGSSQRDGPFGTIVLSARAKGGGYNNSIYYTHSSMLRTLQNIFDVRPYLGDAAFSNDLNDLFKTIQVTSTKWLTNGFRMSFTNVIAGKTNYVQAATNLTAATWTTIKTNVATSTSLTVTNAVGPAQRFYRIVELP